LGTLKLMSSAATDQENVSQFSYFCDTFDEHVVGGDIAGVPAESSFSA